MGELHPGIGGAHFRLAQIPTGDTAVCILIGAACVSEGVALVIQEVICFQLLGDQSHFVFFFNLAVCAFVNLFVIRRGKPVILIHGNGREHGILRCGNYKRIWNKNIFSFFFII